MTRDWFVVLCEHYTIPPGLALENDDIVQALHDHDDDEVERILREEF